MDIVGQILGGIGGLIGLVCYIIILVKMFQSGQMVLGIACIVLLPCCFIGYFLAFIMGWVNRGRYAATNIMIAWTVGLALQVIGGALNPAPYTQFQTQFQQNFPGGH
ncbi:MAG: hypothetical protein JO112_16000 [Planctomycetes bacterium]|nr:hypothetical protein [Planctomycetota bacterium]